MSVGIKDLKQIQKRLEDLRIKQFGGLSIEEMDSELHSIEMDMFKLMDKASARNKPKLKNSKLPIQRVSVSVCTCEMPAKVKGKNECWRCKKPLEEFLQTER